MGAIMSADEAVHKYVKTSNGQLYLVGEIDSSNATKTVLRQVLPLVEYDEEDTDEDDDEDADDGKTTEQREDAANREYRESVHAMAKDWLSGQEGGTLKTVMVKPDSIEEVEEALDVCRAIRYLRACAEDGKKRRSSREFRRALDRFL